MGPIMEPNNPTPDAELYQENYLPLQSFSSLVFAVTPETPLEPRRGRPPRPTCEGQEASASDGGAPGTARGDAVAVTASSVATAVTAALAGPIATAVGQAIGAAVGAALRKPNGE